MVKRVVKSQEIHIAKGEPWAKEQAGTVKPGKLDTREVLQHTTSNGHSDDNPLSLMDLTRRLLILALAKWLPAAQTSW